MNVANRRENWRAKISIVTHFFSVAYFRSYELKMILDAFHIDSKWCCSFPARINEFARIFRIFVTNQNIDMHGICVKWIDAYLCLSNNIFGAIIMYLEHVKFRTQPKPTECMIKMAVLFRSWRAGGLLWCVTWLSKTHLTNFFFFFS